jgi:elongation factor P
MSLTGKTMKVGMVIHYEGHMYRVMETQIVAPGNWRAFVQAKLRNVLTGTQKEQRFRTDESIERAMLDRREVEFLYQDGDNYNFMDVENYEQFHVTSELLGDKSKWMKPNSRLYVEKFEGRPIIVELPQTMKLKVTETEPYMKTATATNAYKNATLETGATIQVPGFITAGEEIQIDTETGQYQGRAGK